MGLRYLSLNLVANWRYQPGWGEGVISSNDKTEKVSPTIQSYYYDHRLIYDQDVSLPYKKTEKKTRKVPRKCDIFNHIHPFPSDWLTSR